MIEGLRIGDYTVSEVSDKASAEYILPADKQATVKVNATAIVQMHNEFRDTPKTGDDFNLGLWVSLASLSVVGAGVLGFVGYKNRKKKKEDYILRIVMDKLTPEQRKKNMRSIKGKDTSIEMILRKALWKKGYHYRKNYKNLPRTPDIALTKYKIAIFCDGEFFHGKDWEILKPRLERGKNSEFWVTKISRNRERDELINKKLLFMGWTVIRFWGMDIKKNTDECIRVIEETIFDLKVSEDTGE